MKEKASTHPLFFGQAKELDEAKFCYVRSVE